MNRDEPSFVIANFGVNLIILQEGQEEKDLSFFLVEGARSVANTIYNQLEPTAQLAVIDNLVSLQDQIGRIVAWYDERAEKRKI